MGWFNRGKAQKEAEETFRQMRRAYETRKTLLFEACRSRAREIVSDVSRADNAGALASNLLTGEEHPPDKLEHIPEEDRVVAQNIADEVLADAEMRDYVGDTIFWLAEALFIQGFDTKTNIQSPRSILRAKELIKTARERAGDKPLYFSLLSQVEMSANDPQKAYLSASRGESNLPPNDSQSVVLRSELLRLKANAAVALGNIDEARRLYQVAKDLNPKITGVDEALRDLKRR